MGTQRRVCDMDLRSNHPEQLRWLAQSFSDVSAVHGFGFEFRRLPGLFEKQQMAPLTVQVVQASGRMVIQKFLLIV